MIAFIIKTNWFVKKDAVTFGPFILVRPEKAGDAGLIAHEKVHVKWFWKTLGTFGILYALSMKWRIKFEAEAYRAQLPYHPERLDGFAHALMTGYGDSGLTLDQARKLIKGEAK
jgi:hypothetical protein